MSELDDFDILRGPGKIGKGPAARNLAKSKAPGRPASYKASRGGVARRVSISSGRKQALLKVTSFGKGDKKIGNHASYISRKGTLELETETGEKVVGLENISNLIEDWSAEGFGERKNSRDTAHIVLGVPPGEDREALSNAVRDFAGKAFEGHRYGWVRHDDTDAPHVHLALVMRNAETGKKIELRKQELQELREKFAESCRSYGIEVDASRAWERGRAPRSKSEQIEYRRLRDWRELTPEQQAEKRANGYKPQLDKTDKALKLAASKSGGSHHPTTPWEAARKANVQERKAEFVADAALLEQAAQKRDGQQREVLVQQAEQMRAYARGLRETPTRQQRLVEQLQDHGRDKGIGQEVERD